MKKEPKEDKKGDSKKKVKVSLFGDEKKKKKPESGEDPDDVDPNRFLIEMVKTLALILIAGIGAYAIIRWAYSVDSLKFLFYPFQWIEFNITYGISKLFGIDVVKSTVYDYTLLYTFPDGTSTNIQIISACTAVCEMGMIMAVILAFRGPRFKKRILWASIFTGIIFVENIIRLVMNYPLYRYLGEDGWIKYHNFWMEYGQLIVVMILLTIYVLIIANKEIQGIYKGDKGEEEEKGDKTNDKPKRTKDKKKKTGAKKHGKD